MPYICSKCDKREGVCTPVMVVPIKRWPQPLYLQYKGTLCNRCAFVFTMKDYTDYDGSWYDAAADALRSYRPPAVNPFPGDPSFKWEDFKLNPNYEPVPREQCVLQFWKVETLAAKSAHVRPDAHRKNL